MEVAEINFDPNDNALDVILEKGVCFNNQFIVLPCRAIDNNVGIVHVSLYSLPFMPGKEMAEILEETLSYYGEVLDLGIFLKSTTQTYICTDYAILNISLKADPYRPLTHTIPCHASNRDHFYATWEGIPDYCEYCHNLDHTKDVCPDIETAERMWDDEQVDTESIQGFSPYLNFLIRRKRREDIQLCVKGLNGCYNTIQNQEKNRIA